MSRRHRTRMARLLLTPAPAAVQSHLNLHVSHISVAGEAHLSSSQKQGKESEELHFVPSC